MEEILGNFKGGPTGSWWFGGEGGAPLTGADEETGLVHAANEELEADDGVDDDDEEHQQGDVQQRHHGLHDGVEDDVEAWGSPAGFSGKLEIWGGGGRHTHTHTHTDNSPPPSSLGTPETRRRGLRTRKARRALTSKPPGLPLMW